MNEELSSVLEETLRYATPLPVQCSSTQSAADRNFYASEHAEVGMDLLQGVGPSGSDQSGKLLQTMENCVNMQVADVSGIAQSNSDEFIDSPLSVNLYANDSRDSATETSMNNVIADDNIIVTEMQPLTIEITQEPELPETSNIVHVLDDIEQSKPRAVLPERSFTALVDDTLTEDSKALDDEPPVKVGTLSIRLKTHKIKTNYSSKVIKICDY